MNCLADITQTVSSRLLPQKVISSSSEIDDSQDQEAHKDLDHLMASLHHMEFSVLTGSNLNHITQSELSCSSSLVSEVSSLLSKIDFPMVPPPGDSLQAFPPLHSKTLAPSVSHDESWNPVQSVWKVKPYMDQLTMFIVIQEEGKEQEASIL